jgi:hypothetical protein
MPKPALPPTVPLWFRYRCMFTRAERQTRMKHYLVALLGCCCFRRWCKGANQRPQEGRLTQVGTRDVVWQLYPRKLLVTCCGKARWKALRASCCNGTASWQVLSGHVSDGGEVQQVITCYLASLPPKCQSESPFHPSDLQRPSNAYRK